MKQYLIYAGLIVIAVVLSGIFTKPIQNVTNQVVGSVTGPDSSFPVETHNGVAYAFTRVGFYSATTSPINIKSPSATSTLMIGSGCNFIVASSSAKRITFAKGATQNASTTFLFGINTAAGAGGAAIATTTTDNFVFAPNNYLVGSLVGGQGVDSPTGMCSFWFQY